MGQPLIIRDERDDGKQYWDSGTRWLIISLVSALISFVGLLGYEIVQVHAANSGAGQSTMVTYSDFVNQVNANNVASVTIQTGTVAGAFKTPIDYPANSTTKVWQFQTYEPDGADVSLVPLLQQHDVMVVSKPASQDNFWAVCAAQFAANRHLHRARSYEHHVHHLAGEPKAEAATTDMRQAIVG